MLAETVSNSFYFSLSLLSCSSHLLEQQTAFHHGNCKTMSGTESCSVSLSLSVLLRTISYTLCPTLRPVVYCNKPNDCKLMPKLVKIQTRLTVYAVLPSHQSSLKLFPLPPPSVVQL